MNFAGIDTSFQSTLPGWGATSGTPSLKHTEAYFNPRSPDGERPLPLSLSVIMSMISIHAPRMGSDLAVSPMAYSTAFISIHAPRMGSDELYEQQQHGEHHFNPRSPDGERPDQHSHDAVG